jgi:hypothetical protein
MIANTWLPRRESLCFFFHRFLSILSLLEREWYRYVKRAALPGRGKTSESLLRLLWSRETDETGRSGVVACTGVLSKCTSLCCDTRSVQAVIRFHCAGACKMPLRFCQIRLDVEVSLPKARRRRDFCVASKQQSHMQCSESKSLLLLTYVLHSIRS